jgi:hypothetical protein
MNGIEIRRAALAMRRDRATTSLRTGGTNDDDVTQQCMAAPPLGLINSGRRFYRTPQNFSTRWKILCETGCFLCQVVPVFFVSYVPAIHISLNQHLIVGRFFCSVKQDIDFFQKKPEKIT